MVAEADIGKDDRGEDTTLMEPMVLGSGSRHRDEITDLALELVQKSTGLKRSLPFHLVGSIAGLVRGMNCYYSNLIEGHDTTLKFVAISLKMRHGTGTMRAKGGFTLVELSIAFVITGLLIGSILTAQSMIETVRIDRVSRQIAEWDMAISSFRTKYRQLPGDSNRFSNPGNNNGSVTTPEFSYSWQHLSEAENLRNTKNKGFNLTGSIGDSNEGYCPRYILQQDESTIHCVLIVSEPGKFGNTKIRYRDYAAQYPAANGGLLRPMDVLALDLKLDDGHPRSGSMIIWPAYSAATCETGVNPNYEYNSSNSNFVCSMFVESGLTNMKQ